MLKPVDLGLFNVATVDKNARGLLACQVCRVAGPQAVNSACAFTASVGGEGDTLKGKRVRTVWGIRGSKTHPCLP